MVQILKVNRKFSLHVIFCPRFHLSSPASVFLYVRLYMYAPLSCILFTRDLKIPFIFTTKVYIGNVQTHVDLGDLDPIVKVTAAKFVLKLKISCLRDNLRKV